MSLIIFIYIVYTTHVYVNCYQAFRTIAEWVSQAFWQSRIAEFPHSCGASLADVTGNRCGWVRAIEKQGVRHPVSALLPTFLSVAGDDLTERSRLEMQIAFNRHPTRTAYTGEFRQNKISPFFFKAAHIAEE